MLQTPVGFKFPSPLQGEGTGMRVNLQHYGIVNVNTYGARILVPSLVGVSETT
jgi:hypothetical protein